MHRVAKWGPIIQFSQVFEGFFAIFRPPPPPGEGPGGRFPGALPGGVGTLCGSR